MPKIHIDDTKIPFHLEQMLNIIIQEEVNDQMGATATTAECMEFVLVSRPLDLLTELAKTDSPPGATVYILNWVRKFLSCIPNPRFDQDGVFQPIQKLIAICQGQKVSPYETEEIMFLLTVAGLVRREPFLINLFLPSHQHSAYVNSRIQASRLVKLPPTKNTLFDCSKIESDLRRVSIVQGDVNSGAGTSADIECTALAENEPDAVEVPFLNCDCDAEDRLHLLDAILSYFDSPVSILAPIFCLNGKLHNFFSGQHCYCACQ